MRNIVYKFSEKEKESIVNGLNNLEPDYILSNVRLRLHNMKQIQRKNLSFKEIGHVTDFAFVFTVDLTQLYKTKMKSNDNLIMNINNLNLKIWNFSTEELYEASLRNACEKGKIKISPLSFMLKSFFVPSWKVKDLKSFEIKPEPDECMYILTSGDDSAAALFYPGVMEWLYKNFGEFYILPSSINEVIILPKLLGFDVAFLNETIRSVNDSVVSEDEVLSDKAYIYDGEFKEAPVITK